MYSLKKPGLRFPNLVAKLIDVLHVRPYLLTAVLFYRIMALTDKLLKEECHEAATDE
jgi:hypothetical protein